MKLTKEISKVVAELEYLIGSECYNPNSYDGWNDIEGRDFRYPVNLPDADGNYKKVRQNLNEAYNVEPEEVNPDSVAYMKYKFGSNELFIGQGIINVLKFLEDRYGLDFTIASPYRLSHATVYINYDGYATYSMTFKPKAKVGLMTAGWTSCFHDGMPLAFFC